ncbi:sensor histidine kinase [Myxococcaceae bacterium GXIMD 01537]
MSVVEMTSGSVGMKWGGVGEAHAQPGPGSRDVRNLDVGGVAEHVVEVLRATQGLGGAQVHLELPEEPLHAVVSHRRLEQVLLLLLASAAEQGQGVNDLAPEIRVRVEEPDLLGEQNPTFHVQGSAWRLEEDAMSAIFSGRGSLGGPWRRLARARQLVESMGGQLSVTSRGARGLTVTVALPGVGFASW